MANTPWRFVDCVADHIAGFHDLGDLNFLQSNLARNLQGGLML
jgi:hypothetical protein